MVAIVMVALAAFLVFFIASVFASGDIVGIVAVLIGITLVIAKFSKTKS